MAYGMDGLLGRPVCYLPACLCCLSGGGFTSFILGMDWGHGNDEYLATIATKPTLPALLLNLGQ